MIGGVAASTIGVAVTARRRRSARSSRSASSCTSASRTQNSSPPHRAMRSEPRVAACSRPCDLAQHGVAGAVPVDVVDALERVDVDEHDRGPRVAARLAAVEEIREVAPVEESRQRVDAREPLEAPDRLGALLLQQALRGDVAGRSAQEDPSPLDRDPGSVSHPADDAVVSHEAVAQLDDLTVQVQQVGVRPRVVVDGAIVGVDVGVGGFRGVCRIAVAPEQRRDPRSLRVLDVPTVGQELAAVEELADQLGGAGEREPGRLGLLLGSADLGGQGHALGDVLDHDDPRPVVRRDTHRDDRRELLAVLALQGHVVLSAALRGWRPRSRRGSSRACPGGQNGCGGPVPMSSSAGVPRHLADGPVDGHDLPVAARHQDAVADRVHRELRDQVLGARRRADGVPRARARYGCVVFERDRLELEPVHVTFRRDASMREQQRRSSYHRH